MIKVIFSLVALLGFGGFFTLGLDKLDMNFFNQKTYQVYFYYGETITPVKRKLAEKEHVLKQAMRALELGPTPAERRKGYSTLWPRDLQIKKMQLEQSELEVYFSPELLNISGGNHQIQGLVQQIVYTATQSNEVERVSFRIFGRNGTRLALGGEGYIIDAPLTRRDFE